MDSKSHIHQKIEETLKSLDNISPASPQPFFYTRLEGRLMRDESNVWERTGKFLSRPSVALASVALVLMLNTFAFLKFNANDNNLSKDQQEVAVADEYNRTTSMFNYNIDNVLP